MRERQVFSRQRPRRDRRRVLVARHDQIAVALQAIAPWRQQETPAALSARVELSLQSQEWRHAGLGSGSDDDKAGVKYRELVA